MYALSKLFSLMKRPASLSFSFSASFWAGITTVDRINYDKHRFIVLLEVLLAWHQLLEPFASLVWFLVYATPRKWHPPRSSTDPANCSSQEISLFRGLWWSPVRLPPQHMLAIGRFSTCNLPSTRGEHWFKRFQVWQYKLGCGDKIKCIARSCDYNLGFLLPESVAWHCT